VQIQNNEAGQWILVPVPVRLCPIQIPDGLMSVIDDSKLGSNTPLSQSVPKQNRIILVVLDKEDDWQSGHYDLLPSDLRMFGCSMGNASTHPNSFTLSCKERFAEFAARKEWCFARRPATLRALEDELHRVQQQGIPSRFYQG
jgi:hypothetical protein